MPVTAQGVPITTPIYFRSFFLTVLPRVVESRRCLIPQTTVPRRNMLPFLCDHSLWIMVGTYHSTTPMSMRTRHIFATLSLSVMLLSFTPPGSPSAPPLRTGTYGVCGCETPRATGPAISLALQDDGSFHYVNGTDPAEQIDVTGHWEIVKEKVTLWTALGDVFETWSVDKNTSCLRSRKGLLFTRLCHLEACH